MDFDNYAKKDLMEPIQKPEIEEGNVVIIEKAERVKPRI